MPSRAEFARKELARRKMARRSGELTIPSGPMSTSQQIPSAQGPDLSQRPQGLSLGNIIEPAATIGSGMIAEPLAGLAGIASLPFGSDTAAENVRSVKEALTFTPKTQEGVEGLKAIAESLKPLTEGMQGLEQTTGDIGADIGGPIGGAIGKTIPTAALSLLGLPSARKAISPVKGVGDKTVKRLLGESAPTIDNLKTTARGIYDELDDVGAVIDSGKINRLGSELTALAKRQGIDPTLHPKSTAALRRINESRNTDLNLTEVDTLRKIAKASAQSIDPSDARLGSLMVDKVDDFLDRLNTSDFIGGRVKGAGEKFKDARQLWQRAKKSELLEDAFEKARIQASGFENGIRTQFRSLLGNKKKMRGFSKEEKNTMRQVVHGGTAENIAKRLGRLGFGEGPSTSMLMGSLGIAGGAAVGGTAGAVAVPVIGSISRKLAQKMTRGNAEFANRVIRAGNKGEEVVKAYINSVPAKQRDVGELTELLLRPGVSLDKLRAATPKNPSPTQKIRADAVFFAEFIKSQQSENNGQ